MSWVEFSTSSGRFSSQPFHSPLLIPPSADIPSLLLEAGIFTSQLLFLLRTRSLRHRAKELNTPLDDMPEAWKFVFPRPQSNPLPVSEELADTEMGESAADRRTRENGEKLAEGDNDPITVAEMEQRKSTTERRRSSTAGAGIWPIRH